MNTDLIHAVIWFRLVERGILTLFVLLACIWLVWKYIDQITSIDVSSEKLPLSTVSTTIGTPVLIVLLFVGYTYVDLSNRIELAPSTQTNDHPAIPLIPGVRLLNEAGEQQSVAHQTDDPYNRQQVLGYNVEQAFTLWIGQNLQRVFISLVNKTTPPLTPEKTDKILNLSLAVGCLNSETISISRNFETFAANKDYRQIESEIAGAMKSQKFANPICNALKQEL